MTATSKVGASAPTTTMYQMAYQNPDARDPLILPVMVVCNTSNEDLLANIRTNSALDLEWIKPWGKHNMTAIMCGGGPSLTENLEEIEKRASAGGIVFAMNGASQFLRRNGIKANYQVIADAKPETATLVDLEAPEHLFASQVDPECFERIPDAILWHLQCAGMEEVFPAEKKKRGGYSIIGGGAAVGNSALCLAYVMGYRKFEIYGYDSSHRGNASHAYDQPMNRFIPTIPVEWAGTTYISSLAMKAQAEKFQMTAQALKQAGCEINVHGDGLLPAMWNTPATDISEQNKYQLIWQFDSYRNYSPGEIAVPVFLARVKPDGLILDFGCGTGRASVALSKAGHDVMLIDFADNCRDEEAIRLPFLQWDLTKPIPARANYGICCDVMEHIPVKDVDTVIKNIMKSGKTVFFQISTVKDAYGALIGTDLHLTVRPHEWWMALFDSLGFKVQWADKHTATSLFIVNHNPSDGANNAPSYSES